MKSLNTDHITTGRFLAEIRQKLYTAETQALNALSTIHAVEDILFNLEKHFNIMNGTQTRITRVEE